LEHFTAIEDREKGLRRGLTSAQLSMIAIGGAIGTGLFLGSSFAIGFAGPSVIVSYVIGAVIALLLMGCLAEMTVAHPTSGSFGAWAEFYISPLAGYLVRYAYWSCNVFAVGTEVTAIAVYMRYWLDRWGPGLWEDLRMLVRRSPLHQSSRALDAEVGRMGGVVAPRVRSVESRRASGVAAERPWVRRSGAR